MTSLPWHRKIEASQVSLLGIPFKFLTSFNRAWNHFLRTKARQCALTSLKDPKWTAVNIFLISLSCYTEGNIDGNKSSITNGICCSTNTKFTKAARKNSNLSQQDIDKKPLNNNNSSGGGKSKNNEHFDGIDEIISAVNTATLKPKKSNQSKSKDRKKIHGSLPNHLDTDVDYEGSDDTNSSGKWIFTILASVSVSCLYRSLTRIVN